MANITEHTNRPESVPLVDRPPSSGGRSVSTQVSLGSGKSTTAAGGGTSGHGGPGQGGPPGQGK